MCRYRWGRQPCPITIYTEEMMKVNEREEKALWAGQETRMSPLWWQYTMDDKISKQNKLKQMQYFLDEF